MFHVGKRLTAIGRFLNCGTHKVEPVKMMRTGENLLVVMGSRAATHGIRTFGPTGTTVIGPPDSTFAAIEFDRGIDHVGILL